MKEYSENIKDVDLLLYGYDCAILGNPKESLLQLIECIKPQGWIILEIAYTLDSKSKIEGMPCESELISQINETNLTVIDKIIWNSEEVKKVNSRNNELISAKINQLIELYPDKEMIFKRYMNNQFEECKTIENDMVCSTWLLKKS